MIGTKIGEWTVKGFGVPACHGKTTMRVICSCGTERDVLRVNLRNRVSLSCGCARKKTLSNIKRTHGNSGGSIEGPRTGTYNSWASMKARCLNPGAKQFKDYGGRGIKVCESWMSFPNFLHDMGERPNRNYSIDRNDNNGNYEPGNCRWATRMEQGNNTRRNRFLTLNGETKSISQWSYDLGMRDSAVGKRIKRGWTIEKALTIHPPPPA